MYRTVEVGGDDRLELLETAGLVLSTRDDQTAFRQPCGAFDGCGCSVYAGRPAVCREYRCLLLRRFESGEVSSDDARSLISRTIALRDRVRPALTALVAPEAPQPLSGLYRLMTAKLDAAPEPAAARREHADLLLDVAALRVLLSREFEPRDSKSHQPEG
jgi:hypothetical protein